jgi:branched-chain amino acid transport system permease protein
MEALGLTFLFGTSYGMVLFIIAVGLSMIFGFMGILNLAHGVVFMFGAYVGITVAEATGNFILAILAGVLSSGLLGLIVERVFLRQFYNQMLEQVLLTFGFVYIITNASYWIWGNWAKVAFVPPLLAGAVSMGQHEFPIYRIAIIIIGGVLCFGLWWIQEKTKYGAIIRAGMDDREMVSTLGINLTPIMVWAFFFGSALAGFAGVVGLPLLGYLSPQVGTSMLYPSLAAVIVGGLGSIQGSIAGALLIGIANNLAVTYAPDLAIFIPYILLGVVLLVRPSGLLGRKV